MKMELLFEKKLTETDIQKRLSVPTVKKRCFLTFEAKHKVEFKVIDSKGKVWSFGCSIRKKKSYPKPVLSKGWLQFVRCWELAIGDKVMVYRSTDKAGKVHNVIDVIRRDVSPLVRNHGADRATAVASYTDVGKAATITSNSSKRATTVASYTDVGEVATITSNSSYRATAVASYTDAGEVATITSNSSDRATAVASYTDVGEVATITSNSSDRATAVAIYTDVGEVATITSNSTDRAMAVASYTDTSSTDQAVSYDHQTEGLHNQPGLMMFEFISLKPDIAVSEPKIINFSELGSQEQREMEYSSILTLHNINMDEIPVTSSTTPYFDFLG